MKTWLADFQERTPLNVYPVALRTRGGIGFQVGNQTISNFVGHPVHYRKGNEWLPITLEHNNGQFEGSDFGWNGFAVTYKKKVLYQPNSITFNGVVRPLNFFLDADNHRLVAYVTGIGEYEILFTEKGVKEILTIPEPLDGLLTFQVNHATKPNELYKNPRHIVGGELSGDEYLLTPDMTYPMVIDPDYVGTTADGYVQGLNGTYSVARSTSSSFDIINGSMTCGQDTIYRVNRDGVKIDTSGIPDTDTISQVNLSLAAVTNSSSVDFDVKITKYNWSANDPITDANREAFFDGALTATLDSNIWRNTNGMSLTTQYASGNLDITWPSKTTFTYYGLISGNDLSNSTPTDSERINIASQNNTTAGYRPFLTVVHAAAGGNTSAFFAMF